MTSGKSLRQDAENALNDKDWTGGEVFVPEPNRKVSIVHSTRLPVEYSDALEAEAAKRGITPSKLMQLLVIAGLERETAGDVVTISRSKLHEAIDRIVTNAA
jgi:predicted ABC-type transport system involved in lysophospholipase L1 biosynthesis ATPase subunit